MGNSLLVRAEHKLYLERKRKKLKNKTPSILANNCNGGIIAHDLGLPFNSPLVNAGMYAPYYIQFLQNIEYYLAQPLVRIEDDKDGWFVAQCDDIQILLGHTRTYEEAVENWERRKKRFNPDNMYVVFCDKMDCTYDIIKAFDALPITHKVIFTHKPYPEFKSACYMPGFEEQGEVGVLSDWKPGFWKRRWLDDFDAVSFLNGEIYSFEKGE
ncbi:MAG: DUF1919 domain-containing protein [Clostridia bacterium]|nr:DUF1919 domain-containing protein [Clostridia bacterium]